MKYDHSCSAILLLLMMNWCTPAAGYLGDTRGLSVKHHGEGEVMKAVAPATNTLKHTRGAVEVTADFIGDTTERITFVKKGVFERTEIVMMLAENAQGKAWKPDAEKPGMQSWQRTDRALAELSVSDGVSRMVITTRVWVLKRLRAYMEGSSDADEPKK